jgi:Fic-DOC domain mobile mystery protein B
MGEWEPIVGETPIDVSGLIPKYVRNREQLGLLEAENILAATIKYLAAKPTSRQAPFTLKWVYRLHGEMFGKVWKWAGKRRNTELNLGAAVHRVEPMLQTLLDDMAYWRDNKVMPVVEQGARLHHRAVFIHPFENGNGRWARMLANIWLKQGGEAITAWPDQAIDRTSVIRQEYIGAVKAADRGDYTLLFGLHEKFGGQR